MTKVDRRDRISFLGSAMFVGLVVFGFLWQSARQGKVSGDKLYRGQSPSDLALRPTADAMIASGKIDDFVPEKGFSRRDLDEVREGLLILRFATKSTGPDYCSGWVPDLNGGDFIASDAHCVYLYDPSRRSSVLPTEVTAWRPAIDGAPWKFTIPPGGVKTDIASDSALIKVDRGRGEFPFRRLSFQDDATVVAGEAVLNAGFPAEYSVTPVPGHGFPTGSLLRAKVAIVSEVLPYLYGDYSRVNTPYWKFYNLKASYGDSGEPIVARDKIGGLTVVGMMKYINPPGEPVSALAQPFNLSELKGLMATVPQR